MKKGRGGARHGAGQPKKDYPRKPRTFHASDKEWAIIKLNAASAGITISDYIRAKVLDPIKSEEKG